MNFDCFYCQQVVFMNTHYMWINNHLNERCPESPDHRHHVTKPVETADVGGEFL